MPGSFVLFLAKSRSSEVAACGGACQWKAPPVETQHRGTILADFRRAEVALLVRTVF